MKTLFDLDGHVALCTGASSGIGRRMAVVLARAGAKVIVNGRQTNGLAETIAEIRAEGGCAAALEASLDRLEDMDCIAARAAEIFGPPDILINAAGVNLRQPWDQISAVDWHATLDLNLGVPFFLARALVAGMRAKGYGRIINIASLQSYRAFANSMAYGASKGGVTQLTRAMAQAWSADGIVANAIAPGFFPTNLTQAVFADDSLANHHAAMTAIGRNGRLEDLDGATIFLASPACAYITGQVLPVDGGYTAK